MLLSINNSFYSNKFCSGRFDRSFWSSSGRYNYSFTFNYSALFEQKKCLRTDTSTFWLARHLLYIGFEPATLLYRFDIFLSGEKKKRFKYRVI